MEEVELQLLHSKILNAEVYKKKVKNITPFTCNYCCFCWLCREMGLESYIVKDVGFCYGKSYVFKLLDNDVYTDDLNLYKEVREIVTSGYDKEEELQLVRLTRDLWLEEKGLFLK